MRLGELLSKPPQSQYERVDSFLLNKKGKLGQQVELNIGQVMLNFFCANCDDMRTFSSQGKLYGIFVDQNVISIDCALMCGCGCIIQMWFLIEAEKDITGQMPNVRIAKRSEKLSGSAILNPNRYGDISLLLDRAQRAYREGFGAGSIVYLRKIFEKVTVQTAKAMGMEYPHYEGGNPKNFSDLLTQVDEQCSIIPNEFRENKYNLFRELSGVVHGDAEEQIGLRKFEPCYRLVIGILENVNNKKEFKKATEALGWQEINRGDNK